MKTPMLKICDCRIDERGRITLPKSFLKANGIKEGSFASLSSMYNSSGCRLEFKKEGE